CGSKPGFLPSRVRAARHSIVPSSHPPPCRPGTPRPPQAASNHVATVAEPRRNENPKTANLCDFNRLRDVKDAPTKQRARTYPTRSASVGGAQADPLVLDRPVVLLRLVFSHLKTELRRGQRAGRREDRIARHD